MIRPETGGSSTARVDLADGGEKPAEAGALPIEYRRGFRALEKGDFSGWLTVESEPTDSLEEALARALRYLPQQGSEAWGSRFPLTFAGSYILTGAGGSR